MTTSQEIKEEVKEEILTNEQVVKEENKVDTVSKDSVQQQNNEKKEIATSINKKIADEIAIAKRKADQEKKIIEKANDINEINNLASRFLNKHFDKDVLLSKGYSIDEIILAQKRELIKKYVPSNQIKAISRVDDIEYLEGELLEQLVSLAKVNIKDMTGRASVKRTGIGSDMAFVGTGKSIADPNFYPTSHDELVEAILNRYEERIQQEFYSKSM